MSRTNSQFLSALYGALRVLNGSAKPRPSEKELMVKQINALIDKLLEEDRQTNLRDVDEVLGHE